MSGPKLIIKQQKSALWGVFWGLISVGLLSISFFIGRFLAVDERQQLLDKSSWLEQQLAQSQLAYQKVNENLVMQTQSAMVDDQSNQQLVDNIKKLQNTQVKLEEELKFYRGIMAPELANEGLTIANFELKQINGSELPRFKLVLTQAGKQEQFLKGSVEMNLNGMLNGQPTSFKFSELGTFQAKHFQFQFRYFQNIEGEIELPQGFIAQTISIRARTQGLRKNQTTEKQIAWNI